MTKSKLRKIKKDELREVRERKKCLKDVRSDGGLTLSKKWIIQIFFFISFLSRKFYSKTKIKISSFFDINKTSYDACKLKKQNLNLTPKQPLISSLKSNKIRIAWMWRGVVVSTNGCLEFVSCVTRVFYGKLHHSSFWPQIIVVFMCYIRNMYNVNFCCKNL